MRDLGLVLGGMLLGWGAEGTWWRVKPLVDRGLVWLARVLGKLWRKSRRDPSQWFRRSDAAVVRPTLPPTAQPGPRPVVGQRASEGAHRATQRRVRFAGRSYRSRL